MTGFGFGPFPQNEPNGTRVQNILKNNFTFVLREVLQEHYPQEETSNIVKLLK